MQCSQATVSRRLTAMGAQLLRLGRARNTRYALRRQVRALGNAWPLYRVDENGIAQEAGQLEAFYNGFFVTGDFAGEYPSLPWFLYDNRPQGFLGRAIARQNREFGFLDDPKLWSGDDVLEYMLRFGADLPGDWLVGNRALEAFLHRSVSVVKANQRAQAYPEYAQHEMRFGEPVSSAAGEQPKFLTVVEDAEGAQRQVLVKFSGSLDNPNGRRWGDLLIAEWTAGAVLAEHGYAVPRAEVVLSGNRVFLESNRIDRSGARGRRAMTSIGGLPVFEDLQEGSWLDFAQKGEQTGEILPEDARVIRTLYAFGVAIGNTDMHPGNLSFYTRARPFRLAPVYDMLPMAYAPTRQGDMRDAPLPTVAALQDETVARMARAFWERVAEDARISAPFRALSHQNAQRV